MKAAFTIITPNYISYANALGDSLVKHNPEYKFFVCLIGSKSDLIIASESPNFEFIELSRLEPSDAIQAMAEKYTAFELSCALKPFVADYLFERHPIERLKYFDSDIMIFNRFDEELERDTASVFLTPHSFSPVSPTETDVTNDSTLLKSGVFNAGFFEVSNTPETRRFLTWWKDRLQKYCFFYKEPHRHIFVDQSWLNLVPVFFKDVRTIYHPGYNCSYFNLHERNISKVLGRYLINEKIPLVFFHFTGYRYYKNDEASLYVRRYTPGNNPGLKLVTDEYYSMLIGNKIEITSPPKISKPSRVTIFGRLNRILVRLFKVKLVRESNQA
jgi:lipopolysaccharide biosynthesis glycosyltransferase